MATKRNKMRRTLEIDSTCIICGREEENNFHATVRCTKSRALRFEMRNIGTSLTTELCLHMP
jgi:formate dehydrogenase assembly factor FdhD